MVIIARYVINNNSAIYVQLSRVIRIAIRLIYQNMCVIKHMKKVNIKIV